MEKIIKEDEQMKTLSMLQIVATEVNYKHAKEK